MNIFKKLGAMLRGSKPGKEAVKASPTQAPRTQTPGYPSGSRLALSISQQKRMLDELSNVDETRELCERLWRFKNLNDMDEAQLRSFLGMLVTWFGANLEGRYIVKDHEELADMLDDIVSWPNPGKGMKKTLSNISEAFKNTPKELWDKDEVKN